MNTPEQYGWVEFPPLPDGTKRWVKFDRDSGQWVVKRSTPMDNIQAILDHNAQARNHTSGKNEDGTMVRAWSIPEGLRIKWMVEEGWDCQKPEHADRLAKRMNDLDYQYLRTGGGRVALQQDGTIR